MPAADTDLNTAFMYISRSVRRGSRAKYTIYHISGTLCQYPITALVSELSDDEKQAESWLVNSAGRESYGGIQDLSASIRIWHDC